MVVHVKRVSGQLMRYRRADSLQMTTTLSYRRNETLAKYCSVVPQFSLFGSMLHGRPCQKFETLLVLCCSIAGRIGEGGTVTGHRTETPSCGDFLSVVVGVGWLKGAGIAIRLKNHAVPHTIVTKLLVRTNHAAQRGLHQGGGRFDQLLPASISTVH